MKIPARFSQLLAKDNGLNALVLNVLTVIEPWTSDNKTVFFPEYTDHSLKHLEEVLLTAEGLILDESWPHLSAEDAAITVLSVLFHDCALHLSEDGFLELISGRYSPEKSRYFTPEIGWPLLWENFFAEAKRFDQRRLLALFGETTPVSSLPSSKIDFTFKHRLLIGEFLRRHHARLAHEISLSGIPGPRQTVKLTATNYSDIADLAGFVARSHNMSLRSAVDRLEPQKRRVHLNCKVPFAMAVLRLADYLQIHAARAPGQLLHLKNLASPVSRGEWKKHSSVKEINQAHDDPEAIFVDANPESAKTFLSMRRLLGDIQLELDQCWAVLGEIYGRFHPLSQLGVGIRRIRSSIDNPEDFKKFCRPSYIPRDFRFKTASAELMDLLVAPLYGDKPEIGIRELIQNAVDACLERDDLIAKGHTAQEKKLAHEDVVVKIAKEEDGKLKLIVEDYGVGMTADVVDRYFLNVGASFRSSDLWRKNHEAEGHATIHRTGRFGIGLLAAFLLGSEIRVKTRHINDKEENGIAFTCTQGDESLEVSHCEFHHGTRIEIQLDKEVADLLIRKTNDWDWYCLQSPRVKRTIPSGATGSSELTQENLVPACDASLDGTAWRRISAEGFDDVLWSYEGFKKRGYFNSPIICNGIYVCSADRELAPKISPELKILRTEPPSIVVYDPDGRFPLNLQRDSLTSEDLSFTAELATDVSKHLAKRLVEAFDQTPLSFSSDFISRTIDPKIPGLTSGSGHPVALMLICKSGLLPADAKLIRNSKIKSLVLDPINISSGQGAFKCKIITDWIEAYCAVPGVTATKSSRTQFLRYSLGDGYYNSPAGFFGAISIAGRRIFIRKSDVSELVSPGNVPRGLWKRLRVERDFGDWVLYSMGRCPPLSLAIEEAIPQLEKDSSFGITILYFSSMDDAKNEEGKSEESPFADAWQSLVGSSVLQKSHE